MLPGLTASLILVKGSANLLSFHTTLLQIFVSSVLAITHDTFKSLGKCGQISNSQALIYTKPTLWISHSILHLGFIVLIQTPCNIQDLKFRVLPMHCLSKEVMMPNFPEAKVQDCCSCVFMLVLPLNLVRGMFFHLFERKKRLSLSQ